MFTCIDKKGLGDYGSGPTRLPADTLGLCVGMEHFVLTWNRMDVSELGGLSGSDGGDIWVFLSFCMCCRLRAGLSCAPRSATTCERSMEPSRIMDSGQSKGKGLRGWQCGLPTCHLLHPSWSPGQRLHT